MTIRVTSPDLRRWVVRRSVVRGRGHQGHRWRWRAPGWLSDLAGLLQLGDLAEIPVIGIVVLVILVPVAVVVLAVALPFLALALVEAVLLALLVTIGVLGATLVGRPILVRAEPRAVDGSPAGPQYVWAVKGWAASRRHRDRVVELLRAGADPATIRDGLIRPAR